MIANLGRADELAAFGALASLIASGAKLTDQVLLINALDEDAEGALSVVRRIGEPLLFGRIWERLGVADVLISLLKERRFEFPVERAAFVAAHFYRAMAWLGEELEEKPTGALAARSCQGPDRGEAVRPSPRPLRRVHGLLAITPHRTQ